MFYVRTPAEGGQEAIAGALSILWLVVPHVQDIHFKDLKQTLRKEQCDVRTSEFLRVSIQKIDVQSEYLFVFLAIYCQLCYKGCLRIECFSPC